MNTSFKNILTIIILVYIGFGAYLFLAQRSLIYLPNYPAKSDFYDCPAFADAQKIIMNGTRAYYKPVGEKIVVMYHGNAGSACDRSFLKDIFEKAGYSYLFVEYAGYAGDTVKPSRALLFKDAQNVTEFLKAQQYQETVLFAESIGTGIASHHASLLPPDRMFFIAPFDSLANVAESHLPFSLYPISLMLKFSDENYDNVASLKNYRGGLTIIHGTADDIIPIELGRTLFDQAQTSDKTFIAVLGAGHNDIYNFDIVWQAINDFLHKP